MPGAQELSVSARQFCLEHVLCDTGPGTPRRWSDLIGYSALQNELSTSQQRSG